MVKKNKHSDPRLVVRITPNDELHIRKLFEHTAARNKSEVVRYATTLLADLWEYQLLGAKLELRTIDEERVCRTLLLGGAEESEPEKSVDADDNDSKFCYYLQLRMTPEDEKQLSWLQENGAGCSRSSIIRSAIDLYYEIVDYFAQNLYLWVRFPAGDTMPIELLGMPKLRAGKIKIIHKPVLSSKKSRIPRNVFSLQPGDEITFQEIKELHRVYPWKSILIKVESLYDEDEFLPIVEKHIRHGTELYYLHYNPNVIKSLKEQLYSRNPDLKEKIQMYLKLLPVDSANEFESFDDFVFFNFLEKDDHKTGFQWYPKDMKGVMAYPEELEYLWREFRGIAKDIEKNEKIIATDINHDHEEDILKSSQNLKKEKK